jgi:esterase
MKLFYRQYGSGNPVIVLHGLFGVSDNWISFARGISGSYTAYVPDLRNHGQSPHSPIFNFASMEDDVMELIEDAGIRNPILIGHSLGGKVAMNFALHHPEMVKKLVVVDISLRNYSGNREHQHLLNAMLHADLSVARSRSDVERQLLNDVPDVRLRQFLMKNVYWREKNRLDWRPDLNSINENLFSVFEGVTAAGLYAGPSLFIRGSLSTYVTDEDIQYIKMKFPGAVVTTIANASHWVHADNPGEFFSVVSGFLGRVSTL